MKVRGNKIIDVSKIGRTQIYSDESKGASDISIQKSTERPRRKGVVEVCSRQPGNSMGKGAVGQERSSSKSFTEDQG